MGMRPIGRISRHASIEGLYQYALTECIGERMRPFLCIGQSNGEQCARKRSKMKLVRVVKMKSFMSLLAFAASMSLLATTEKVGDYTWNYRINGNTAEIYQESTKAAISPYPTGAVTIPSTLGGKPVTKIGQHAFYECRGLTSVTIPDSVTSIDGFSGCTNLVSITIPDSVTRIEWGAFARCSGLTSITIPNSVTNIGGGAFQDCVGLVSMTLPFIGAQRGCSSAWDASFFGYIFSGGGGSSQYSSLEYQADQYYPDVHKTYYIPRTLESVVVTDDTEIYTGAFSGCKRLKNVIICDGPKYISRYAFYNCGGLSNVTLPDSVTQINERAFFGCDGLTNITIPRNVTKISPSVFSCNRLTSVMFLGSAPTVYTNTFVKVAASCTAYVKRFASWGWGVAIPGTWNGIAIDYVPEIIPEIPSGCSSKGVTNAIEAAGFADAEAVKAAIAWASEDDSD